MVHAHVTAPDDGGPRAPDGLAESGRLRVVEDDDVVRAYQRHEPPGVGGHRAGVDAPLDGLRRTFAVEAVEMVVQALGHLEEALLPADDDPAGVRPGPPRVADQALQELSHTAAP